MGAKGYPNPRHQTPSRLEKEGHSTLFYLHITGTAGGSIRQAINQYGGNHRAFVHHKASKMIQVFPGAREKQIFACIRDPRERALKAFFQAQKGSTWSPFTTEGDVQVLRALFASCDFNKFFELVNLESLSNFCHHFAPQVYYLDAPDIALIAFDYIEAGLIRLTEIYGGEAMILPEKKIHKTNRPSISSLTKEAEQKILDFYAEDFNLYSEVRSAAEKNYIKLYSAS